MDNIKVSVIVPVFNSSQYIGATLDSIINQDFDGFDDKFYDYPISLKAETIKNMGFFTTMEAGMSYLFRLVFKKKETSLENFYINRYQ